MTTVDPSNDSGFGGRVGFGRSPVILVIDLQKGLTASNLKSPLGSDLIRPVVENTAILLKKARERHVPIIFTVSGSSTADGSDLGLFGEKLNTGKTLKRDTVMTEIDDALSLQDDEVLLQKSSYSAFFGTDLLRLLLARKVDTIIITGCSTSSCVQATCYDSIAHQFHTIVPSECIGDRSKDLHRWCLMNIDLKCGDVLSLDKVLSYLDSLPGTHV